MPHTSTGTEGVNDFFCDNGGIWLPSKASPKDKDMESLLLNVAWKCSSCWNLRGKIAAQGPL